MKHIFKIVLLILGLLVHRSIEKLHDGFSVCKVKESNFDSCLGKAIENALKFLKKGLPDYNLPSVDPFHIPSFSVGAGTSAVNLVQNYNDALITGFSDAKVNNTHMDFNKKVLSFSTMNTLLEQKAQYEVDGKILMMPVHGKGPCTLSLENNYSDHVIEFEEVKKQGEIYYSPKSYDFKLNPNLVRYNFENLFDGNKLLGDNINNLLNQEWLAIFQDVRKGYEETYAKSFLQYTKGIFDKVPVKDIFIQ